MRCSVEANFAGNPTDLVHGNLETEIVSSVQCDVQYRYPMRAFVAQCLENRARIPPEIVNDLAIEPSDKDVEFKLDCGGICPYPPYSVCKKLGGIVTGKVRARTCKDCGKSQ